MRKLSGNYRYRKTWWGKRILQVEEWVLVSPDVYYNNQSITAWYAEWRDATDIDISALEEMPNADR